MKVLLFASLCILMCSCASVPTSLSASTSPIQDGLRGTIETRGKDCQYSFLFFPITPENSTFLALKRAKERADVDVMTDVTVDYRASTWILLSRTCVIVQGMGVTRDAIREAERL